MQHSDIDSTIIRACSLVDELFKRAQSNRAYVRDNGGEELAQVQEWVQTIHCPGLDMTITVPAPEPGDFAKYWEMKPVEA